MTTSQQQRIALSAALGLGAVALVVVVVLGLTAQLDLGTAVGLLLAVVLYGALVLHRLRRSAGREG